MKVIYLVLLILLAAGIIYAADVKKDRPLDVSIEMSADENVHEAIYAVLKAKGVSCEGLATRKDGIVTILKASNGEPKITIAEIQAEIDKIRAEQDIEKLIAAEMRELALASLRAKGKIK